MKVGGNVSTNKCVILITFEMEKEQSDIWMKKAISLVKICFLDFNTFWFFMSRLFLCF